jgi:hypothetical protein
LPIQSAAADPHPHPRCFRLPQLLAVLAPLGEVFASLEAQNAPAQGEDESPELVVVGDAPGFMAMGQTSEVLALGYVRESPGLGQAAPIG